MDLTVGAFEAKTHLPDLLRRAEKGERILITRHGKPIAKLIPATSGHDRTAAYKVADQIRELAKELHQSPFDWEEWKQYRDEGREQ